MKIIFSRKGFDSANGGVASPILPDGRMISLPIPYASAHRCFDDIAAHEGSVGRLVEELTRGRVQGRHAAHLDPDLHHASLPRPAGWRPAFGQIDAAQSHLAAEGVGPGDLFLFFGWFREVETGHDGRRRFRLGADDIHALFGWLQIGDVLPIGADLDRYRRSHPWLRDHPHLNGLARVGNTIYVAADRLRIGGRDLGLAGGGIFRQFHPGLRLTAPAATRTVWTLPGWFLPEGGPRLSYHRDAARWQALPDGRCLLRTVAQGQEFVMDCADRLDRLVGWLAHEVCGDVNHHAPAAQACAGSSIARARRRGDHAR